MEGYALGNGKSDFGVTGSGWDRISWLLSAPPPMKDKDELTIIAHKLTAHRTLVTGFINLPPVSRMIDHI